VCARKQPVEEQDFAPDLGPGAASQPHGRTIAVRPACPDSRLSVFDPPIALLVAIFVHRNKHRANKAGTGANLGVARPFC
jgi:hypothetical protein